VALQRTRAKERPSPVSHGVIFLKEFRKEKIVKIKIFTAVVLVVFLYGCVSVIDPVDKIEHNPSIGQELIDLKKALDEGAITENEYFLLKQKIMDIDKHK
jgi:hypothetical protein